MAKLIWGSAGKRFYEAGVDQGVLYIGDSAGVPWDGLISVSESPSGGESTPYYLDGVKYANASALEEFAATIEAYTYPDSFAFCDGSSSMANGLFITQQQRKSFGLVYRTKVGNDIDELGYGYKLHIVYNAQAEPSSKAYSSTSDSSDVSTFSWSITTRPMKFSDPAFGVKYGAHLVLDSRIIYPWAMAAVEAVLFGDSENEARLPSPSELLALFVDNALLKILDNGDGTWTADGPPAIVNPATKTTVASFTIDQVTGIATPTAVTTISDANADGLFDFTTTGGLRESTEIPGLFLNENLTYFSIDWPSVVPLDDKTFQISSL